MDPDIGLIGVTVNTVAGDLILEGPVVIPGIFIPRSITDGNPPCAENMLQAQLVLRLM